jgi:AcrR family transcriptional regulator
MAAPQETPRAEATRARLLAAAVSAFAERGYHATTTRDIAAAAGMSPAALYVHHASKEELLYEIARRGHAEVLAALGAAVSAGSAGPARSPGSAVSAGDGDAAGLLRATVYAFAEFHVRSHTSARVINFELAALTPEHYAEIHAARREIEQTFRRIIERGIGAGSFDLADARMPALAIVSLGVDITRWYHPGGFTAGEIAAAYADMALRIVGAG